MRLAKFIGRLWGNRVGNRLVEEIVADVKAGKHLQSKPNPKSGALEIVGERIRYQSEDYGSWELPLAEIKVVGEYTSDNGPYIDDWFLVLVTGDDQWVEASNYCGGQEEAREALVRRFGMESLWGKLWGSTEFASRVLAPSHLAGQPLFEFQEVPQSVWTTIKRFGLKTLAKDLTPPVLEHINSLV